MAEATKTSKKTAGKKVVKKPAEKKIADPPRAKEETVPKEPPKPKPKPNYKPKEETLDEYKKRRGQQIALEGRLFASQYPEVAPTEWHGTVVRVMSLMLELEYAVARRS